MCVLLRHIKNDYPRILEQDMNVLSIKNGNLFMILLQMVFVVTILSFSNRRRAHESRRNVIFICLLCVHCSPSTKIVDDAHISVVFAKLT